MRAPAPAPSCPSSPAALSYRFGCFELQLRERRLLADGAAVPLGPRGFDLLVLLVEQAGHLVTKDELFRRVWPQVVVDDSALQFQVSLLRKILGAQAIATVSGQGYRFVLAVSPAQGAAAKPNLHNLHNLQHVRHGLASFIGREREAARLDQSLRRARLVTLTGAGGCGKTRLAVEVAAAALQRDPDAYPDGVWLVEMAPLADAQHLPQAVLNALGLQPAPGSSPLQTLTDHLATRRLLLLLDNAEHLLAACAALAEQLLQAGPGVALLATSRQALGVVGELTYRVPSLALPDITQPASPAQLLACASVQLFVDRARLLRPHFAVTPQNAAAVALVCWRLDGIPLAIELAAGRLRTMPVEELSQRLNQRFSLLIGGAPGALPRHRTLRALIDWSYDLLSAAEQALLCRLSVFAGGCTLQAAEQVCSAGVDSADGSGTGSASAQVLDLLAALADKNLVAVDEQDGGARYRLLETVRQYAQERLQERGDAAHWQARHWAHFMALGKDALPHNHGPEQQLWFDRFEADNDNLRVALRWAQASGQPGEGLRLAGRLAHFWMVRGYLTEGRAWYARLLAALPADHAASDLAIAYSQVGTMATLQGDYAAAKALCTDALALFRGLDDGLRIACTLNNLGSIAECEADFTAAAALTQEAVALFRRSGHRSNLARALVNLGNILRYQGALDGAQAVLDEGLAIARDVGARQAEGTALAHLGTVATLAGRPGQARTLLHAALGVLLDIGDRGQALHALEEIAHLDASGDGRDDHCSGNDSGNGTRPAQLWGLCAQLRESLGLVLPLADQARHAQRLAAGRAALHDDAAFDSAWQAGRQLSFRAAVALALSPA